MVAFLERALAEESEGSPHVGASGICWEAWGARGSGVEACRWGTGKQGVGPEKAAL